jgi:signal transduction histidine kinase
MMIADRIVSLGLLAAGLSHHIRNSLVAVKTFLDLAPAKLEEEKLDLNGLRNPDFWKEYYQNVQAQITKINGLLKDLWTASEPPTFQFPDRIELRRELDQVIAQMQGELATKSIQVTNNIPAELPAMQVDKPKFMRLFELLLKDEIATLPTGCQIQIGARLLDGSEDAAIQVQVSDNGPGMPTESLRLVFDPFVVRSDSPAEYGIHLMACYFIVHHHGGRIEAHNGNTGTTFTLRLPLNPTRSPGIGSKTDAEFLQKVLLNDSLWEKLITSE